MFFGVGSPQEKSPKRAETLALLKKKQQKQKRKLILPSVESEFLEEETEVEQEQEVFLQRTKRQKVAVSTSDTIEPPFPETTTTIMEKEPICEESEPQIEERGIEKEPVAPLPRRKRKKVTVPATDLVEDPIHEAAAKAVEQEHSKEIIVFERAEKKRQQQLLRDEAATADALQRETVRKQQTAEHYSLRSSPTSVNTSRTSKFFHTAAVFSLSTFDTEF